MSRTRIKYVELLLVSTSKKNPEPIRGLLTSFPPKSMYCAQFIGLHIVGGVSRSCSLDFHYIRILKIVFSDGLVQKSFFKDNPAEQRKAINAIKDTMLELRVDNIASPYNLVTIDKYLDIPKEFLKSETTKTIYTETTGENYITRSNLPVKEMTFLKRKTKKPSPEHLELLKQQTMLVTANTYVGKELPPLKEDAKKTNAEIIAQAFEDEEMKQCYSGFY